MKILCQRVVRQWQGVALAILTLTGLVACNGQKFSIEGEILGAQDSMLYFENVSLTGPVVLGSVKLSQDGTFSFSEEAPAAPEFYRLRIADQIINIAIDSTETVTIKAQWPQMSTAYEVAGSENCQTIKELSLKQIQLQDRAIALQQDRSLLPSEINDSLLRMVNVYKEEIKRNYIFKEPQKSYAYFALFQTLGPWLIFDPKNNPDDVKVFAAVATCWDTYFPGAERGENLHNIAIDGMKNVRIVQAKSQQVIDESKVVEAGVIDIELTDNQGQVRRLSDLKGQVVLLDFHLFGLQDSPQRILTLRELYNKYHAQGLEIYQVSLDSDEHFWKQTTAALPWISVRDPEGPDSQRLMLYNVQSVPEFFLIDRGNNLVKRSSQIKDIDTEIKALL